MRRWIDRASVAVVIALLVMGVLLYQQRSPAASLSGAELFELSRTGIAIGEEEPAATIIVFSDYGCGWCAEYSATLARLLEKYPQHAAVVYKDFVLDTAGPIFQVHLAARCAHEQGVFRAFQTAAFQHQDIGRLRNGWRRIADIADVPDRSALEVCVRSERHASAVHRDRQEAHALGFTLTPSSLFGPVPVSGSLSDAAADSLLAIEIARVTRRR